MEALFWLFKINEYMTSSDMPVKFSPIKKEWQTSNVGLFRLDKPAEVCCFMLTSIFFVHRAYSEKWPSSVRPQCPLLSAPVHRFFQKAFSVAPAPECDRRRPGLSHGHASKWEPTG